jgi:hypothetical protein
MMSTTTTNGRVRKSLAEQIDRLDSILDGLADNLNDAVVTAVKEAVTLAVREAVRGVLTEVLMNPELLEHLRGTMAPPAPVFAQPATAATIRKPGLQERLGQLRERTKARIHSVLKACRSKGRQIKVLTAKLLVRCQALRHFKWQFLTALGIGGLVGVAAFFAGPYVAAAAGWLVGFGTALAVQAGVYLKRMGVVVWEA